MIPVSKTEKRLQVLFPDLRPPVALAVLYQQYSVRTIARMLRISVAGLYNWGDRHGVIKGKNPIPKRYKGLVKTLNDMPGLDHREKLNRLHMVFRYWDDVARELGVSVDILRGYRRRMKLMRHRDPDAPKRQEWIRRLTYDKMQRRGIIQGIPNGRTPE